MENKKFIEGWLDKFNFTDREGDLEAIGQSEFPSEFALKVVEQHPLGFCGGIVYGKRRIGKSVYALKVMVEIFKAFGCTEDEAWELAFASLYFDPRDLLKTIRELASRKMCWPIVTLDDAGVGAGRHIWFTDRDLYYALDSVLVTVGKVFSGFILTTPNFEQMLNSFKDAQDVYRIEVKWNGRKWDRRADAYLIRILPSGTIRVRSKRDPQSGFVDEFSAYLVNERYKRYDERRWSYVLFTADKALSKIKHEGRIMKGGRAKLEELRGEIDSVLSAGDKEVKRKGEAQT